MDKKKTLYDALSTMFELGSYNEYSDKLNDENKRKALYDAAKDSFDLGDYDTFNRNLGYASAPAKEYNPPKLREEVSRLPENEIKTAPKEPETMMFDDEPNPVLKQKKKTEEKPADQENNKSFLDALKERATTPMTTSYAANNLINDTVAKNNLELESQQKVWDENNPIVETPDPDVEMREQVKQRLGTLSEKINGKLEDAVNQSYEEYQQREDEVKKKGFFARLANEAGNLRYSRDPILFAQQQNEMMFGAKDNPELAKKITTYQSAQSELKKADNIIKEADVALNEGNYNKWQKSFLGGATRGLKTAFNPETWSEIDDLEKNILYKQALDKADRGEQLTEDEQDLLDSVATNMAVNAYFGSYLGAGYKAGQVTAESLPFMLEMAINPASRLGTSVASKTARYALRRFGNKTAARAAGYVARGLGDIAGSAIMTATTGAPGVAADALQRMTDNGEDFWSAAGKAFGARTIENYSEMLGEYFEPILGATGKLAAKGLDKVKLGAVNDFIDRVGASKFIRSIDNFFDYTKWNGTIGEFAEEMAGGTLNALIVGDQTLDTDPETGVFNQQNMLDTFLGVALMGGFVSTLKTGAFAVEKTKTNKAANLASAKASVVFGDDWLDTKKTVQDAVANNDITGVAAIYEQHKNEPEKTKALLDYMKAYSAHYGSVKAYDKLMSDNQSTSAEMAQNAGFENGYTIDEAQEMNDAKNALELAREKLRSTLGVDDITVEELNNEEDLPYTDEEKAVALDYLQKKSVLEGIEQRTQDTIEEKAAAVDASIDARTSDKGTLRPATTKTDEQVHIVSGEVIMQPDGKAVDKSQSSDSIVIVHEDGKKEMVSPDEIAAAQDEADPNDAKAAARTQIESEVRAEQEAKLNGTVSAIPGNQYSVLGSDNMVHTATVVADETGSPLDQQGNVYVQIDGQPQPVPMPLEELQRMSDAESRARAKATQDEVDIKKQTAESPFEFNDIISVQTENGEVRGQINSGMVDGKYEVVFESPVKGKQVREMTPAELEELKAQKLGSIEQPAQQEITQEQSNENVAETAPQEVVQPATETIEETPQVTETAAPETPKEQQSALSKIPQDEVGNYMFEQAPSTQEGWDALVEFNDGNEEDTVDMASTMLAETQKELAKTEQQKLKGKTPTEIKQNRLSIKQQVDALRKQVDFWAQMAQYPQMLQRMREEEAKRQKRERLAEARRIQRQNGRYGKEDKVLGEPFSFREFVMRNIANGAVRFKWANNPDNAAIKGLAAHLGLTGQKAEQQKRVWMLDGKEGLYPETAAEELYQAYAESLGLEEVPNMSPTDALGVVLDVILSSATPRDMFDAAKELHYENDPQALEAKRAEMEQAMAEEGVERSQSENVTETTAETENEEVDNTMNEPEETDLSSRVEVLDDDVEEKSGEYSTYRRSIIIDGKHSVTQVDEPNENGEYLGSYYEYDGKRFAGIPEVIKYIDDSKTSVGNTLENNETPENPTIAAIQEARQEVDTEPSDAQKKAGNYRKGHLKIDGYDISIENPKGSMRRGIDSDGEHWEIEMQNDYGYIRGTESVDGDHIDVYLSDNPSEGRVFVVDQINPDTGEFDEHKVMYGFADEQSARDAYLSNYDEGWQGLGNISEVSKEEFSDWIKSSKRKTKPFTEYKVVDDLLAKRREVYDSVNEGDVLVDANGGTIKILKKYPNYRGYKLDISNPSFGGIVEASLADLYYRVNEEGYKKAEKPAESDSGIAKQVNVEGLMNALSTKGQAKLSDFAEDIPQATDQTENDSVTIEPATYTTKAGKTLNMFRVNPGRELSKDEWRAVSKFLKDNRGWKDRENGGFMVRTEENANELANMLRDADAMSEASPVSLTDMQQLGSVSVTNSDDTASTKEDTLPEWGYELVTYSDGYSYLARYKRMPNGVPVYDGRHMAEANDPETLEAILKHNNLYDLLSDVDKSNLESRVELWKFRKRVKTEGINGLKLNDKVIYKGKEAIVHDFEDYGDHRPVLDVGLSPIAYEVVDWDKIEKIGNSEIIFSSAFKDLISEDGEKSLYIKKIDGAKRIVVADYNTGITNEENANLSFDEISDLLSNNKWIERKTDVPAKDAAPKAEERPVNPSGNKLVTDERYAELRMKMMQKLKGQLNIGIDPEILAIGTEMAVYHIEKGARKFVEYAKAMIADLSDAIRPYLKAFYNGARDLPEIQESGLAEQMDSYADVQPIDVANFDKQTVNAFATAEQVVNETKVEEQVEKTKKRIKNISKASKRRENNVSSQTDSTGSLFENTEDGTEIKTNNTENNELPRRSAPKDGAMGEGEQQTAERPDGRGVVRGDNEYSSSDNVGSRGVAGATPRTAVKKNQRNNRVGRGENYAPSTPAQRFSANVAAIKKMRELTDSGKSATPEDMEILRKFTGWGGIGSFFNNEYSAENRLLKTLLTDEEYQEAVMSANTAYYTPTNVIDAMWDAVKKLGFKGGKILEGSAGIGNILASMPGTISDLSDITAVEIDRITGNILKLLYPDANVEIKGFEETNIPNNSIDLAITNVPFATGLHVYDKAEKDLSRKFGDIHDFCIAKNVRKLKEGGIGIFITSKGTLDKSKALRNWVVNEGGADFIGAFRLNNETFIGTKVTSDIIIIRKRINGKVSPNAIDVSRTEITRRDTYIPMRYGEKEQPVAMEYNAYFIEHPEYMAGEMKFAFEKGDTFRPTSTSLYPSENTNQDEQLKKWVKSLRNDEVKNEDAELKQETISARENTNNAKEGQIIVNSKGEICVSRSGVAVPLEVNSNKVKGYSKETVVKDYDAIKDALKKVLDYQTENESDEGLKPLLKNLNKAYDDFVKKYGSLNKNTSISFLRNDVDFASTSAIENYKETESIDGKRKIAISKTDVFSRRMIRYKLEPTPKTSREGVIVSLNKFGRIDLDYISSKTGLPIDQIRKEIIDSRLGYENPENGQLEVSYEYLSGNVREKLDYAISHNENGKYDSNISALEKVIPYDIPAHLIEFSLGSDWLNKELYIDFAREKYGLSEKYDLANIGGVWKIVGTQFYNQNNEKNRSAGISSDKVGKTAFGHELMLCAMNNTPYTFQKTEKNYYTGETITITDKDASQAATNRMSEIKDEFKEWARDKMMNDPVLAEKVQKTYNNLFNAVVPKTVTEEFLPEHFDNSNIGITLYPHQKKAVIRGTTEPLMLAHEVGSGKTFTLISTAMEMRRLGTARKPMIVVQNATVGQFVSEAKKLYPNAKVLALSEKDRSLEGRYAFYAKIKYNDWDLIIVPQSTFDLIPDSEERQRQFIQEKIDEKMYSLQQAKEANADDVTIRNLEKELRDLETEYNTGISPKTGKKNAKKEAEAKSNAAAKARQQLDRKIDEVADFDDMGIDALLVDEAHEYKHLGFSTSIKRGVKGIDPSYSKKSAGLYLKTRAVFDKGGWKNVVFATGTPISNTAAEIWTFMKYLMPADVMKQNHIYYFDDFVRNFGKIAQSLEFATNGKFKENTRFGAYVNVPELVRIWSSVCDTVLTKDAEAASGKKLTDKLPKLEGGKAEDIFLPQSPSLIGIMRAVRKTLEEYEKLSGKEKKEQSHIPLMMYGIAKRAAIDPRLVDANAIDEPLSKTNRAVQEILKDLKQTDSYKGTCAVFCDNYRRLETDSTGKKVEAFNLFYEIKRKLIEAGIPENQIVVMESGMSIEKKENIFSQVNDGSIRVILGSTKTLGTGVNIQQRLHLLIHMDAPDRPMDYTQRNGRILRQGNLHKEWDKTVKVQRFGVEDSLDVTSYQRLKTKSSFINSIMDSKSLLSNNMEGRVLEEEEEGLFDNPVAVLSGSQYALKKSQAERELRKYQSKLKQYQQDQIYIERQLKHNNNQIASYKRFIEDYKESISIAKSTFNEGKVKVVTVAGVPCRTEEEISTAIREKITKPLNEAKERARTDWNWHTKTYNFQLSFDNVNVNVSVDVGRKEGIFSNGQMQKPSSFTEYRYSCPVLLKTIERAVPSSEGIKGIVQEFRNNLATGSYQQNAIDRLSANIERMTSDNDLMLKRRGIPFSEQDKLNEAKARVSEYTKLMKEEMAEKEQKYANAQSIETSIDVSSIENEDPEEEQGARNNLSKSKYIGEDTELDDNELSLRDTLVDILNASGVETITDTVSGKAVLDEANGVERQEVNESNPRLQKVYHGSGANFDEFDFSYMGSGEGAQAYGYGAYVTEVEGIGRSYASKNGGLNRSRLESEISRAQERLPHIKDENTKEETKAQIAQWQKQLDELGTGKYLYSVEIPDDNGDNYIPYERTLPKKTRRVIADALSKLPESELSRDNHGPKWLPDGWNTLANTIEREQYAGKEIRERLADAFGDDKKVSEFLNKIGFVGYSVPTNYRSIAKSDASKNYVIFNEKDLKITDKVQFFKTPDGHAYGFTVGGKIYIDPRIASAETPIHEYAHLWAAAMRKLNPEEWNNIVSLMKGTPIWDSIKEQYPELKSDEEIADEVLAQYSGKRGAERLRAEQKKIAESKKDLFEKADAISAIERVKDALKRFWKGVADFFGIHFTTAEEVADKIMSDMLNGVNPTQYAEENIIKYSRVTDKKTLDRLNNEPTIKTYRAMQLQDGVLYPPMAAKVEGKWNGGIAIDELGKVWEQSDERPDLVDDKGNFTLNKGNGTSLKARYNPYIHTSTTPLNDQFSSAQDRPELVTVEVEVPESELSSGYKAEKAKDAVGKVEWKAGVIQAKLSGTRTVILSRWDKPMRIVPDSEVADIIVKMFDGKNITMPSNVVTPSLRAELEKRGVPFVETDNQGKPSIRYREKDIASMETPILTSKGTFKNLSEAEDWVKRNLQGKEYTNIFTKSIISIGRRSVKEILSPKSSMALSVDLHLAALRSVPDFIINGIPAEIHKDSHGRDFDVMRLYSAIEINEKLYRVKSTIKRVAQGDKYYTYEVQEMELIEGSENTVGSPRGTNLVPKSSSINSITGAKLLNGVKKTNSNELILPNISQEKAEDTQNTPSEIRDAISELSGKLGVKVRIVENVDEITDENEKTQIRKRGSLGWYDTRTGEVVVVLPNATSVQDAQATVLHEIVGHKSLRELVGKENFNDFLDKVFAGAERETREKIIELAKRNGWDIRLATEEYMAQLAENGFNDRLERNLLEKIRDFFTDMLSAAKIKLGFRISDNELRYMLWRSYKRAIRGIFDLAEDVVMQDKLDVGNYAKEPGYYDQDQGQRFRTRGNSAVEIYEDAVRVIDKNGKKSNTANLLYRLHEAYQDSMLSLKKLQEAVTAETGNTIEDNENAYMAENAMSSKNKAEQDIYMNKFFKPLQDVIIKLINSYGTSYNDIMRYMMAKHGLERNEYMARKLAHDKLKDRYDKVEREYAEGDMAEERRIALDELKAEEDSLYDKYIKKDYSGLSALTESEESFTEIAQDIVDSFEKSYPVDELWKKTNAATRETLRKNYESGIISKDAYENIKSMFEYYIPLRGWQEGEAADEYDYLNAGRPIFTPTLKKMKGRTSIADDPIATIGNMAQSAIALGNRNLMKQKFLNFAMNNKTSLLSINRQWYVKNALGEWEAQNPNIPEGASPEEVAAIVNDFEDTMKGLEQNGLAKTERDGLNLAKHITSAEGQEHAVKVKRAGKEYVVYINGNPRAAQALNGLTNPSNSDNKFVQLARVVKNFMARMFTSQNPAFIVTNLCRDLIWSSTSVSIKENQEYKRHYQRTLNKVLGKAKIARLISKFNKNILDDNVPIERYFKEFIENGGETGYTQINTVDGFKRDMDRLMKEARNGVSIGTKAWRKIWDSVEYLNRCAEDTTRFAVYMTSRQIGRSIARSVKDAKDITVNFNKKGSGGYLAQFMNFAYIFFNATVQSLANVAGLVKNNPKKFSAAIGTFMLTGAALPLLAIVSDALVGGDDDDEAYWDLPEWVRRTNLVFKIPFTKNGFLTIPLPHELRPFYGMGEIALSCLMGKESVEDGLRKAVESFSTMLPFDLTGNGGSILVNFTPSFVQPIAQTISNIDYFGTPIYKKNDYNVLDPDWTKAYKGTSSILINGAKLLNDISGGNAVEKGYIDINPAIVEHLLESYFGGVGKTINRTVKTVSMVWDPDARLTRNVPIVSSFIQQTGERNENSQLNREYYDFLDDYRETEHKVSGYKKQIRMGAMEYADKLSEFMETDEFKNYAAAKGYVNAISKINTNLKYADDTTRTQLEKQMIELKKQLLKELD